MTDFFRSLSGLNQSAPADGRPAQRKEQDDPPPQDSSMCRIGDIVSGYKICKKLGEGGFGSVYLAQKGDTDELVALKTFREGLLASDAARESFKKEALLWVQLDAHPFVLAAQGITVSNHRLFVMMDYVAPDLKGRVHLGDFLQYGEPIPLECIVKWSIQFCMGMEHANAHGIRSHRDIKPANILISHDVVKIADFGLAAAEILWKEELNQFDPFVPDFHHGNLHLSIMLTDNGMRCGTPGYIAPEIYRGEPADVRSDIFSFGLVLWQMTESSVHPPFIGPYTGDIEDFLRENYKRQMAGRIPSVSGPMAPIIERCLSPSPAERYSCFSELRGRLEPLYKQLTGSAFSMPAASELGISFWLNRANAYIALDRANKSITCLDKALEIDPANLKPVIIKAAILSKLTRHQEALECCDKSLSVDPQRIPIILIKGEILEKQKRYDEAVKCYDSILSISSQYSPAWIGKARVLFKYGRHNDALDCCSEAISNSPHDIHYIREKYIFLRRLKKHKEALVIIDNLLSLCPLNEEFLTFKAMLLMDMNRQNEAETWLDQAIKANRLYIPALCAKGNLLRDKNAYVDSISFYDRVLTIDPENAVALNEKGYVLLQLGKLDEANQCFSQALAINSQYEPAWYNKGAVSNRLGRYDEAIACCDKVLALNPANNHVWFEKGYALHSMKCYEEAIYCYNISIKLNAMDSFSLYNRAIAEDSAGKQAAAISSYEKYLTVAPRQETDKLSYVNKRLHELRGE